MIAGRLAVVIAALTTSAAGAQESLLPSTGWGIGSGLSAWHFGTPLPQTGGALADVAEAAIPFRLRSVLGRWSVDLSGAGAFGAVRFAAAVDSALAGTVSGASIAGGDEGNSSEDRIVTIFGPTDVKLRITGPLISDNFLLTLGFNLPSGKVGLDGDETSALQAIGAPALAMPVAAFGTGAGYTVGFIRAFDGDEWAVAVGGSVEQRSEYSPIAVLLADGKAETKVAPGSAVHATLGFDRTIGASRLSALLVGDLFSTDKVSSDDGTGTVVDNDFKLGPQVALSTGIDFGAGGWRESSLNVAAQWRGEFSDSAGAKVSGSSGTYFEGSFGGIRGGPEGAGFVVGTDARWHSGLKFTDALVGAAVSAVGLTLGLESVGARSTTRFTVRGQYGTFDTGTAKSSGFSVTLGMSVGARRAAQ